ncbi:hypothetical protein OOJ91_02445 [Micromonospora lupini]|uniref:hypothetical protein n=1 Tax=Micromonospora lupini TaxID=285679 RepID=UPI0022597408|nr:hypothetical protein [Micromonospora lupini]MCX5064730.1 hypothetical protein [Micromonospora lupini]
MNEATRPAAGPTPRAYPVPRAEEFCEQPYLTYGCLRTIAEVLIDHGFPRPQGHDFVALRNAAEWFLYDSWDSDSGVRDQVTAEGPPPLPPGRDGYPVGVRQPRKRGRGCGDARK